jgi:hypothetical protein
MHTLRLTTACVWLVLSATCRMAVLRGGLLPPSPLRPRPPVLLRIGRSGLLPPTHVRHRYREHHRPLFPISRCRRGTGEEAPFLEALDEVRLIRLRDGAFRWEVFSDPAAPGRYVETFEVASWAEHLRQHERATVADQEVEARALAYQESGTEPIDCRTPDRSAVHERCDACDELAEEGRR